MSSKPSNAAKSFSDAGKSGIATGRAGTVVLAGMAAGLLMLAGCQAVAQTERVHIRQEMDYATVDITDSDGSISRVRLRREGIGRILRGVSEDVFVGIKHGRLPVEFLISPR